MGKSHVLEDLVCKAAALDARIKREQEKLDALKEDIKSELVNRSVMEFACEKASAKLTLATSKTYDVDKLRDLLNDAEFRQLCPPTPNGKNIDAAVQLDSGLYRAMRMSGALTEKTTQRLTLKTA